MPLSLGDQLRPTADELCVAMLWGQLEGEPPLRIAERSESTREALERLLLGALQAGPVWIAYSGGRDSSALLAIAADVARREGLELPVPVTMTIPGLPEADEEDWQRLVLDHLDLTDRWVPLRISDELEMLGEPAQRGLRKHGVLLPPNAHGFMPMVDAMPVGGVLVTGGNGDELLTGMPQRISSALLSGRTIPRERLRDAAIQDLPGRWLDRHVRRHSAMRFNTWVRMPVLKRLVREEVADRAAQPLRFDALLRRAWTDRDFRSGRHAVELLTHDAGRQLLQPFGEHDVVAAFARDWSWRFPGTRTRSLRRLVGDLLPERILTRESKAEFARAFVGEQTRTWINEWDGQGVDPERVDVEVLRREWQERFPHYASMPLLHHAWLVEHRLATGLRANAASSSETRR